MARRRRKGGHEALGVGLILNAAGCWIAAASVYVAIANETHPRWWIVIVLSAAGVLSLLLGLVLYVGVPFRKDRLAVEVFPSGGMNVVSELQDGHPRKTDSEGMVFLHGIRFTSLEGQEVTLAVELIVDFPDGDDPVRLPPLGHSDDLLQPIYLKPVEGVTGDLSFPWNWELMARLKGRETRDVFSLRVTDIPTSREATVPLQGATVTDKL